MVKIQELEKKSVDLRKDIVNICYNSKAGHIGGSLSSIDILNTLYNHELNVDPKNPKMENRDRFILSKGHVAEALFVVLADCGFFDKDELKTYSTFNSKFIGHPNNKIPGIEMNTGALGHGLSLGVGCALAAKMNGEKYRTYVLMGDGEQAEGSIWEAAMAASHYNLDNLVAIVDRNGLQISGSTEDVMSLKDLKGKWEKFGFNVIEINGNNYEEIVQALNEAKTVKGMPTLILADTVKGKGISYMENKASWHHGVMTEEQYELAISELEEKIYE